MLRTAIAAITLAGSATLALAATDDELSQQLAGIWAPNAECAAWSVAFDPDGSYLLDRPGTDQDQPGKWSFSDGVLSLIKDVGNPEPDTTVVFGHDDTVTITGSDKGQTIEYTLIRCRD